MSSYVSVVAFLYLVSFLCIQLIRNDDEQLAGMAKFLF